MGLWLKEEKLVMECFPFPLAPFNLGKIPAGSEYQLS